MEQEHAGVQGFRVSDQGEASGLPLHRRSEHLLGDSVHEEVEVGIQTHIRAASRGQCHPEAGGVHSEPQHGLLGLETPGLVEKEAGWRGGIRRGDIDCLPCLLPGPHRSCLEAPNMSFGVQAQQLAVDFAVIRPLRYLSHGAASARRSPPAFPCARRASRRRRSIQRLCLRGLREWAV